MPMSDISLFLLFFAMGLVVLKHWLLPGFLNVGAVGIVDEVIQIEDQTLVGQLYGVPFQSHAFRLQMKEWLL